MDGRLQPGQDRVPSNLGQCGFKGNVEGADFTVGEVPRREPIKHSFEKPEFQIADMVGRLFDDFDLDGGSGVDEVLEEHAVEGVRSKDVRDWIVNGVADIRTASVNDLHFSDRFEHFHRFADGHA